MNTIKMISGARKFLVDNGFVPTTTRKAAGLQTEWKAQDGRTANVAFQLFSRTGQSSRGAGATWGYEVKITGEAA